MVEQDLTLHTGSDFSFSYVVPQGSDFNLDNYKAACKIRKRPYGEVILELQPVIESKQVTLLRPRVSKQTYIWWRLFI